MHARHAEQGAGIDARVGSRCGRGTGRRGEAGRAGWRARSRAARRMLEVRRSGGLFGPRTERLYNNGRDRTPLVHGLVKQVEAVRGELETVQAGVPVRGALCFVGIELPWFGSSSIVDVLLVARRGLTKLLCSPGDLDPADRDAVAAFLDHRFPPTARLACRRSCRDSASACGSGRLISGGRRAKQPPLSRATASAVLRTARPAVQLDDCRGTAPMFGCRASVGVSPVAVG